jgi:diguanylate cyclase (GGDEF)-like protein
MLGFFYLVLFWFLNDFGERSPLVKWTTSAVLITLLAQFVIELVGLHEFVHANPILNFIVHFLFGIAYFIFALSVFKESFIQATNRHIRKASFDYNDAVLFDYDKRKRIIDIQFSQSFCDKYKLEHPLLSLSEMEFRQLVVQEDLDKSNWFDERLPHDAIINQKYHMNFSNIPTSVALQVKGSYQVNTRVVVLAFDVSALETAEADLLSSNSRRIELLENLPLGIIEQKPIFDDKGVFIDYEYIYCNKAFGRMTGYPPDVVVGNKASVIIPNQYKERITKFGQAILDGKSVSFDTTIQPINHTFSVNVYPTVNKTFISIYQDIHQLKVLNEQLHYLATHDKMTNLYNQRGLLEMLEERTDIKTAVCFYVSIGNYELIYDFYGYTFIEGILKQLSDAYIPYNRSGHLVATTSSSDLIVLLVNPTSKEVNQALEAARASVYRKMTIEHTQVLVKQNIGYAVLGEHADNIQQLIACASLAMSEAASSEHNIIVKYVPKLKETLEHNIAMANKLDEALENGLIRIAFQNIVDSRTGEVVLLEALARWTDDKMGYIAPDVIFEFAKKSNMIDLLDDYLLENTLKEYAKLKHKGVTGR